MAIYNHERSFAEVYADPSVSSKVKERLHLVEDLKKMVENELGVKATSNYTSFVQLDRPVANWVLIVAEPYELKDKNWCFPIVGCFPYLGFFKKDMAQAWAEKYKQQGYDTHVRGAAAYSTLGYLRDPLLSSMLSRDDGDMANLIFHETTHSHIYLSGQGAFNEGVASFIGEYGERLFLSKKHGEKSDAVKKWAEQLNHRRQFGVTLRDFADQLKKIYKESPQNKEAKNRAFSLFREKLKQDETYGNGAESFTNNAVVLAHLTYDDDQSLYDAVYAKCSQDLKKSLSYLQGFSKKFEKNKDFKDTKIQDALRSYLDNVPCG